MATPTAVIFDNDGLLLDTESVWTRAERDLFARRGLEFTLDHKRELVGTSAEIAGGLLERHLAEPGQALEIVAELEALVFAELEGGVEPMAGAVALVDELRAGAVPVGLASNSPPHFIARALELVDLADRFDAIASGHEMAAPKPAPDVYLAVCERLGVAADRRVVVLEDSPTGVAAGRAAGLTVIGVPSLAGIELVEAHELVASLSDMALREHLGLPLR